MEDCAKVVIRCPAPERPLENARLRKRQRSATIADYTPFVSFRRLMEDVSVVDKKAAGYRVESSFRF